MEKITKPYARVMLFAGIWFVTYVACLFIIKNSSIDTAAGVIISLIPVISFAFFLWAIIKGAASMDEVQIRIQLEAVVIAFSLTLLTLMTLGLLDLVIVLNKEDWGYRHLVPFISIFYVVGLLVSKRKYE